MQLPGRSKHDVVMDGLRNASLGGGTGRGPALDHARARILLARQAGKRRRQRLDTAINAATRRAPICGAAQRLKLSGRAQKPGCA